MTRKTKTFCENHRAFQNRTKILGFLVTTLEFPLQSVTVWVAATASPANTGADAPHDDPASIADGAGTYLSSAGTLGAGPQAMLLN